MVYILFEREGRCVVADGDTEFDVYPIKDDRVSLEALSSCSDIRPSTAVKYRNPWIFLSNAQLLSLTIPGIITRQQALECPTYSVVYFPLTKKPAWVVGGYAPFFSDVRGIENYPLKVFYSRKQEIPNAKLYLVTRFNSSQWWQVWCVITLTL